MLVDGFRGSDRRFVDDVADVAVGDFPVFSADFEVWESNYCEAACDCGI